jgi:hypothetical protein
MKYLNKTAACIAKAGALSYETQSQRKPIRDILLEEQFGFCAYSERFIKQTDSIHIEHFDGRLKNTTSDNYQNWYAVLAWMNEHKPKKIDRFLPLLHPTDANGRITYSNGVYLPIDKECKQADNLIKYLGMNSNALKSDRDKHIRRIKKLQNLCQTAGISFIETLRDDLDNLSFITALEYELNINLSHLLPQQK